MQLHREWLMNDLKKLQTDRKSLQNIQDELHSLETEYTVLKATSYDKIPSGNGGNSQLDKMEMNLAKREELTICLQATREHVEFMENLLNQLDRDERDLIDKTVILHSKTNEQMAEQFGIDPRQIYNRKRTAIDKLLHLRFGRGYRP